MLILFLNDAEKEFRVTNQHHALESVITIFITKESGMKYQDLLDMKRKIESI